MPLDGLGKEGIVCLHNTSTENLLIQCLTIQRTLGHSPFLVLFCNFAFNFFFDS